MRGVYHLLYRHGSILHLNFDAIEWYAGMGTINKIMTGSGFYEIELKDIRHVVADNAVTGIFLYTLAGRQQKGYNQ